MCKYKTKNKKLYVGGKMIKIMLVGIIFTIFTGVIFANPIAQLDNWAEQQTENFEADDAVHFLERNRDYGDMEFGPECHFNEAMTSNTSAAALDDTHFIVAYRDVDNSHYGTAVVGTVSGLDISYGSEFVFNPGITMYCSVTALDNANFLVAYMDMSNSSQGTVVVGTVTGTNISFGYEHQFNAGSSSTFCSVTSLGGGGGYFRFVVAYSDWHNGSYGTAVVGDVSGSWITYGEEEFVFNTDNSFPISITTMNAIKFVVAYNDGGNSEYGTAVVGTVSGFDISFGSEVVFSPYQTSYFSTTKMDANHIVVAYLGDLGRACVGTVSGSNISFNDPVTFLSSSFCEDISTTSLDEEHFMITFHAPTVSLAVMGTFSVDAITSFATNYWITYTAMDFNSTITMDETHFVTAFQNSGHSSYGTAIVGEVITSSPPVTPTNVIIIINGDNVNLSWDDMGASNYNIYRSIDPYAEDWGDAIDNSDINNYIDVDAASGTKNFYFITSEN